MFNAISKLGLAAAALVAIAAPGAVLADPEHHFSIQNTNASASVQHVWTKRTGMLGAPWTEIELTYPIGPKTVSTFTLSGTACLYDVRIRFSDNEEQAFDSVNVCRGQALTAT